MTEAGEKAYYEASRKYQYFSSEILNCTRYDGKMNYNILLEFLCERYKLEDLPGRRADRNAEGRADRNAERRAGRPAENCAQNAPERVPLGDDRGRTGDHPGT